MGPTSERRALVARRGKADVRVVQMDTEVVDGGEAVARLVRRGVVAHDHLIGHVRVLAHAASVLRVHSQLRTSG